VPAARDAAGQLYWYAVTHITGPISARTSLNELLHSWKLPVPGLTPAGANHAVEASVVAAAGDSILARKSVHIVITGHKAGSTAVSEQIVADIGTAAGAESIKSGAATATIRVTPAGAYFTGSPAGLKTFIGLPAAAARRAQSRWVAIKPDNVRPEGLRPGLDDDGQRIRRENQLAAHPGGHHAGAAHQRDDNCQRRQPDGAAGPLGRAVHRPGTGIGRSLLAPDQLTLTC